MMPIKEYSRDNKQITEIQLDEMSEQNLTSLQALITTLLTSKNQANEFTIASDILKCEETWTPSLAQIEFFDIESISNKNLFLYSPTFFNAYIKTVLSLRPDYDLAPWIDEITFMIRQGKMPFTRNGSAGYNLYETIQALFANILEKDKLNGPLNALIYQVLASYNEESFIANLSKGETEFQEIIRSLDGKGIYFLHAFIAKGDIASFRKSLKYMGGTPIHYVDSHGRTFLHVAKDDPASLELASLYTHNINHQDRDLRTALHITAQNSDLKKANFLLANGANPNVKDINQLNFWEIKPSSSDLGPMTMYRFYKSNGNALQIPPEIMKQKGLTCGFYAVACAVNFLKKQHLRFFKSQEPIYARKSDATPKATTSLRQKRKELSIPGRGAIFSTTDLAKLIETAECKTLVCDIANRTDFVDVIRKAIDLNIPVIIPFSIDSDNNVPASNPSSLTAHWATAIAYTNTFDEDFILLAQYGTYTEAEVNSLYHAFDNIDETFPKSSIFKFLHDWDFFNPDKHEGLVSAFNLTVEEIPLTDLSDFRRKLVLVLPPHMDPKVVKDALGMNTPALKI